MKIAKIIARSYPPLRRGLQRFGRTLLVSARRVGGRRLRRLLPAPREPRLLTAAGGIAGGLLALGAGGVLLASRIGRGAPRLSRSLPVSPKSFDFRGHRVAYYEQGQGEPIVLLHGIYAAASAYEMREPFARLSANFHVLVPDLLGFGASDRPVLRYRADLFVDLIVAFLREVVGQPANVLATSLSGAYAVCAAVREPRLFRSLVLVNPTGVETLARPQGLLGRAVERLYRAPVIGQGFFNLLVSRPSLRYYYNLVYGAPEEVTSGLIEHSYQTAHQPGARLVPAAFVGHALNLDLRSVLPQLTTRALAVWTQPTRFQDTDRERAAFARLNPRLGMLTLPSSGALPYDEEPARFAQLLVDFIRPSAGTRPLAAPPQAEGRPLPAEAAPQAGVAEQTTRTVTH